MSTLFCKLKILKPTYECMEYFSWWVGEFLIFWVLVFCWIFLFSCICGIFWGFCNKCTCFYHTHYTFFGFFLGGWPASAFFVPFWRWVWSYPWRREVKLYRVHKIECPVKFYLLAPQMLKSMIFSPSLSLEMIIKYYYSYITHLYIHTNLKFYFKLKKLQLEQLNLKQSLCRVNSSHSFSMFITQNRLLTILKLVLVHSMLSCCISWLYIWCWFFL